MNELTVKKQKTLTTTASKIATLHGQLEGLVKKSVETIYKIGELLVQVKESLPHGEFTPWIEGNLPFTDRTARTYMRVFDRFKTETVSVLSDLSVTEAYLEAGVKKLLSGQEDGEKVPPSPIYQAGLGPLARFESDLLRAGVRSNAILKAYRVASDGNYIVAARPGVPPMTIGTVDLPWAPEAQEIKEFLLDGIMQVYECAFERLEAMEEAGIIDPPVDQSISGRLKKGQKLAPKRRAS